MVHNHDFDNYDDGNPRSGSIIQLLKIWHMEH